MNRLVEAPDVPAHDLPHEPERRADDAGPAARTLHVQPTAGGRWAVCHEHDGPALSAHYTANEAQYFARQRARIEGIDAIVVHDAYQRIHDVVNVHPLIPVFAAPVTRGNP
jgi:hypothetical protein